MDGRSGRGVGRGLPVQRHHPEQALGIARYDVRSGAEIPSYQQETSSLWCLITLLAPQLRLVRLCVLEGAVLHPVVFLVQIVDDLSPHFFLFGVLRGVSIAYRACTLLSQCGGKGSTAGPGWMDMQFTTEFSSAARVTPQAQDSPDSFVYDAFTQIPIPGAPSGANIQLLSETRITCYDLPSVFPRQVAPEIWKAGSSRIETRSDNPDACQRPETLGADYRGQSNATMDGSECESWSTPSPAVCTSL
jgi:hypothetical protein